MQGWSRPVAEDFTLNDDRLLDADCASGKKVTGGGYALSGTLAEEVKVLESVPKTSGSGWRVFAVGPLGDWGLRVFAICADDDDPVP